MKNITLNLRNLSILWIFIALQNHTNAQQCGKLTASFGYQTSHDTVTFTNGSSHEETSFWDLGDGTTSTKKNPVHVYANAGIYHVILTVTCDSDSASFAGDVKVPEVYANFSYQENELSFQFTNLSINATSFFWDFGDGTSDINKNPTHLFAREGIYTICLTAINQFGNQVTCKSIAADSSLNESVDTCWYQSFRADSINSSIPKSCIVDEKGNIYILVQSGSRVNLIKYNSKGSLMWNNDFRSLPRISVANGMVQDAHDNLYVLASNYVVKVTKNGRVVASIQLWRYGYYLIQINYHGDFFYLMGLKNTTVEVAKYDTSLNLVWHNETLWVQPYYGRGIILNQMAVDSGDNVFSLITNYEYEGEAPLELEKISSSGKTIWTFPWSGFDFIELNVRLLVDSKGNAIISDYNSFLDQPNAIRLRDFPIDYVELVKINSDGDWVWTYFGGSYGATYGMNLDLNDNIYWLHGDEYPLSGDYLMKFDSNGNILWAHFASGYNILGMQDDSSVIIGGPISIFKFHPNGDEAWTTSFDVTPGIDNPSFIQSDKKGNMFIAGTSGPSVLLVKYCKEQALNTIKGFSPGIVKINSNLTVYPNPTSNLMLIRFLITSSEKVDLELLDIAGRTMSNIFNGVMTSGEHKLQIDLSDFKKGIYFLQLKSYDQIITKKLIVQ